MVSHLAALDLPPPPSSRTNAHAVFHSDDFCSRTCRCVRSPRRPAHSRLPHPRRPLPGGAQRYPAVLSSPQAGKPPPPLRQPRDRGSPAALHAVGCRRRVPAAGVCWAACWSPACKCISVLFALPSRATYFLFCSVLLEATTCFQHTSRFPSPAPHAIHLLLPLPACL
jgi:hypothetical protein